MSIGLRHFVNANSAPESWSGPGLHPNKTETYDQCWQADGSEGRVTATSDVHGQGTQPESERTVTVTGLPLLITGLATLLCIAWILRRFRRAESKA